MMNCNDKHSINNPRDCLSPCEHPKTFNCSSKSCILPLSSSVSLSAILFPLDFVFMSVIFFLIFIRVREWQPPHVILPFLVIANVTSSKASSRRAYHLSSCHHLASNKL